MESLTQSSWTRRTATHLLNRTSFGRGVESREAFFRLGRDLGVEAAVDSIVNAADDWGRFPFPTWWDSQDVANGPFVSSTVSEDALVDWYIEQIYEANPLGAKMFKFLVDHCPVDTRPLLEQNRYIYLFQHFDLCRTEALGNARAFIRKLSWDPAMMWMLDMRVSRKGLLNENFGRELLELFTLGVGGGYSEEDVVAAARAFTGRITKNQQPVDHPYGSESMTTRIYREAPEGAGEYVFIDGNEKEFLGKTFEKLIPFDNSVVDHGDEVIDHIFDQPACARFWVEKLWVYFCSPEISPALLETLAERFRTIHNYEFQPLLKEMFLAEEFYLDSAIGNQVKDPVDLMVSCVNLLEVPRLTPRVAFFALSKMGYDPVRPPSIEGWPKAIGAGNAWLGAEKMLLRINLGSIWTNESLSLFPAFDVELSRAAQDLDAPETLDIKELVPSYLRGEENIFLLIDELNEIFLPLHPLSPTQRREIERVYAEDTRHLPEEERLRELVRLFMSLPEFQMQ